jgi:hypothetical protein
VTTRNIPIGVVLTPAALARLRRIADATPDLDVRDGPAGTGDEVLAELGDRWVELACEVQLITKDTQHTHDVLTDAVNRAVRQVRGPR